MCNRGEVNRFLPLWEVFLLQQVDSSIPPGSEAEARAWLLGLQPCAPSAQTHGVLLSPQLISRKGLSRSLFTATKKWFGGSKAPEKGTSEPKSTSGLL